MDYNNLCPTAVIKMEPELDLKDIIVQRPSPPTSLLQCETIISFYPTMTEHEQNLLLVKEVEKHPILYNPSLAGYSRKDDTFKAWTEIGKIVNLPAADCKDKWRNIRTVFIRNIKIAQNGNWTKDRRAYYLSDAMQFIVPYLKALGNTSINPTSPPKVLKKISVYSRNPTKAPEKEVVEEICVVPVAPAPLPVTQQIPEPPVSQTSQNLEEQSVRPTHVVKKKRLVSNDASDERSASYSANKGPKSTKEQSNPSTESLRMFLLSMLPDLQEMSASEVRQFKRRTLDVVDDILSARRTQHQDS